MNKNLETIRAACIKANPNDPALNQGGRSHYGLTDVLLAIWQINPYSYFLDVKGDFWVWDDIDKQPTRLRRSWNLRKDSLEEQSEETLQFLADLLTH